jgi:thiamine-monophosphate kinase
MRRFAICDLRLTTINDPLSMPTEFAYISWLRQQLAPMDGVILGPGDDCALLKSSNSNLLVTTDMLMEGSCFLLAEAGALRVGRKAMNVNLSDIAAMGGIPRFAVVSVGLPRTGDSSLAKELYRGLRSAADEFQVSIVGGDTNSWSGGLTISVTLIGEEHPRGAIRRSGAKPGDAILVTGPLGGSILGHHLDFRPRVREALQLQELVQLHSMIDISDGLAKDLHHICEESNCGAILNAEAIPITTAVRELSQRDQRSPLEHALQDGEDFELVFTVAAEDAERLVREQPIEGVQLALIGKITEAGYEIEIAGRREKLLPRGYEHEW